MICEGVCCAMNRNRKSMSKMKGAMPIMSSTAVSDSLLLAIMASITAKKMR